MPGRGWTEESLSESPAVTLLQRLGYSYVEPEVIESERESLRDVMLVTRLAKALKKLNPWLDDANVQRAVKAVTHAQATNLIEASENLHTTLTRGISVEQDRGQGKRSYDLRFFDFENATANELIVTRQFKVKGAKKNVIPDALVFVNGIPLVVIECKSPTLGEKWLSEAVNQVHRYQELGSSYKDLGAPRLFETVQLIVVTCGQAAKYGTVGTPQRFFADWKTAHPRSPENLEAELGKKPSAQELLVYGLLAPANLLDIMRNFVAFEVDSGRTIRKVCRYQQFVAVNRALERAKRSKKPTERGGVVWHTQGSGKSLTMLWLATKLRREEAFDNPTLVVVTDRRDLDKQIADTFIACGFPDPHRATSVRDLREKLAGATGVTVMTTVQKFQELVDPGDGEQVRRTRRDEHPTLSEAFNVFVLADEAHRTQYGGLAANMRSALPNACFLGFTGTPIDKNDKSTLETFGPYIDTYTIEQAVADEATVPIFYESRLPELRIVGHTLDQVFDRVFADRPVEEREAIKKRYANEQAIAEAPRRIEMICLDIIDHFTKYIRPNGFKAQIVAVSRDAAVTYKETLDKLNGPSSALMMSTSHNDEARLANHHKSKDERDRFIKLFKDTKSPEILVVCDMLLTGFDAPVEQVMYLDSPLKEHSLLQAIARVNRTADHKTYGLVVDYWGVSGALQEALAIFSPSDVKGAMAPKSDELPRLQARHAAALRFFGRVRDKDDLDTCVAVLEPEDVRAEFETAFKRFGASLDMMLPDPRALRYADDMRWLGKIRQAAAARFREGKLDISDCGEKVRKLIEEAVIAEGIQILVKQVSIFSSEFDEKLGRLQSNEAKASEMEHAIRHEIHVRLDENPIFYTSLRERLEKLIEDRKQARIDAAEQLRLLDALVKDLRGEAQAAEKAGLSEIGFAIYGVLEGASAPRADGQAKYNDANKELANLIEEAIEPHTAIVEWTKKDDVQREIRRLIKRHLKAAKVPPEKAEQIAGAIIDIAKVRKGR